MPDVGLTSSSEPLSDEYRVVIKYTAEVDGLPVYTETYDAEKLRKELESDEQTVGSIGFAGSSASSAAVPVEVSQLASPAVFWMAKFAMRVTSKLDHSH